MIIGLSGYARSGKDSVADILTAKYGFKRLAFADKIREFLLASDTLSGGKLKTEVETFGWEMVKADPDIRGALQNIGIAARQVFGEHFWVEQVLSQVMQGGDYVVTDVRFPNEMAAIHLVGGRVGRVSRAGVGPVNQHISEVALDTVPFNFYIKNDGTLKDLGRIVKFTLDGWLDK